MAASDGVGKYSEEMGKKKEKENSVKVICLGDSAVGKSK